MSAGRIAIIGAGNIGATLGGKWIAAGHSVLFGVRDPESSNVAVVRERLGDAEIATISEALRDADVVLLAVTGAAVEQVVADYGKLLDRRIVIDATNQLVKGAAEATGEWGERKTLNSFDIIQKQAPDAALYRAFNGYGWEVFAEPVFGDRRADLFYCGPAENQVLVEQLITEVGLRPVRVGGTEEVETVDSTLALWAALAVFEGKGRANVAFGVLER
ncbi:NAD(P)-binding domain-containing protein [Nocardia sp. NEAU-G5]|uniref:NAD(P)-binding domain-containing protein n=1 Tax=Nocardia albiluteola TaxID=2842303 RepID=A0ABS6B4A9_9NOCA|nr:NAD(P)-binding domain-containing protein [Nocardia albiluteola]MBU3064561.1 NAD(P)-binding domain-containing protein [Nocardia albiluteola]